MQLALPFSPLPSATDKAPRDVEAGRTRADSPRPGRDLVAASNPRQLEQGIRALLDQLGYRTLTEFKLASGRRVDVIGIDRRGRFAVVEIKSGPADLRADRKWRDYLPYCDWLYFGVGADFPLDLLPDDTGIIVADQFSGEILRESPRHPMATPKRRGQTLLFAHAAGDRLYRLQCNDL